MKDLRVCVVGAGVVGLSVALYLAEECKKCDQSAEIVVVAESFLDKTTSHGSGGLWEPYKVEGTLDEVINIWGKSTFDHFQALHKDSVRCLLAGVRFLNAFHLCDTDEEIIIPTWNSIVNDFRLLNQEEVNNLENEVPKGSLFPKHKKFTSGTTFKTYTVDQSYYLKYLTNELLQLNVKFETRKIEVIDDLTDLNYDVIVNCCGIRGSSVSGDQTPCHPIRGQVVRVKEPLMQSIYFFGTSYIIPNVDTIVCGGTAQINDWNTKISDPDTKKIMGDIYECFPEMENSELCNVWVGLRPARVPLRLDSQIIENIINKKNILICHCYGHGGSGVTLSWGCAEDIVKNHILPFLSLHRNN